MSNTPETDAQLATFTSVSKYGKHFENKTGSVSAEFARNLERERDQWRECAESLAEELQRLADCDWTITLPDRMDAVRDIARKALSKFERLQQESK